MAVTTGDISPSAALGTWRTPLVVIICGCLIALLSYPFILEPAFGLKELSRLWTLGFLLLVVALALVFVVMRTCQSELGSEAAGGFPAAAGGEAEVGTGVPPKWMDRLGWIGLALVPAALLTAFTTHVTTDVASAPLLWVLPLSLYLLTFVLVFREKPLIPREALLWLHLAAVAVSLLALSQTKHETWFLTAATGVAVFFTSAMVAHRTLYEARPATRYLTAQKLRRNVLWSTQNALTLQRGEGLAGEIEA